MFRVKNRFGFRSAHEGASNGFLNSLAVPESLAANIPQRAIGDSGPFTGSPWDGRLPHGVHGETHDPDHSSTAPLSLTENCHDFTVEAHEFSHLGTSSPNRPPPSGQRKQNESKRNKAKQNKFNFGEDTRVTASNPYSVLQESCTGTCLRGDELFAKARNLVKWYSRLLDLEPISSVSSEIRCGELRRRVRGCFPDVSPHSELSFKTIAKLEKDCCDRCLPRFEENTDLWKSKRVVPVDVDLEHLALFREAFIQNIPQDWDDTRTPFIPNGNATCFHSRRHGGNWNKEILTKHCTVKSVFSGGKQRIVTLFSSENTRLVAPLHYSLYGKMKKSGWLLVGDPTDEKVSYLKGAQFLSFDYESATDNIKLAYVRTAIEALIERSVKMTEEEKFALRVIADYEFEGLEGELTCGQPMGYIFSFPLLCLINKTVVDLSLNDLIREKKISFKEWQEHRCLINGDDLLTREVRKDTDLRDRISYNGSKIGLKVNEEKTMSSDSLAEINSTLFQHGSKLKKFNASSLTMDAGVQDVLGYALQSTYTSKSFRYVVRANCNILSKQEDKHLDVLPPWAQSICRRDAKIRRAITSFPSVIRGPVYSVFRMEERPEDYDLDSDAEYSAIVNEIDRVRERAIATRPVKGFRSGIIRDHHSYSSQLKRRRPIERDLTLSCLVREDKKRKWARIDDGLARYHDGFMPMQERMEIVTAGGDFILDPAMSRGNQMISFLRSSSSDTRKIKADVPVGTSLAAHRFEISSEMKVVEKDSKLVRHIILKKEGNESILDKIDDWNFYLKNEENRQRDRALRREQLLAAGLSNES